MNAGHEPRSWVWICYTAPERWTADAERDARVLQSLLQIRTYEVLRHDKAAVYDERTGVELEREPTERHFLTVFFACAPANVNRLREAALAELVDIARKGIGRPYLDKVAARLRKQHELDVKDNEWWLDTLRDAYRQGESVGAATDVDALLARVTSDRIRATAARMVRGKPHIAISLVPEAGAGAPTQPPKR